MDNENEMIIDHDENDLNDEALEAVSDDEARDTVHIEWAGFI